MMLTDFYLWSAGEFFKRFITLLHTVFLDEIHTKDTIQAEMLRMLMARFIIKVTRLLKSQSSENSQNVYGQTRFLLKFKCHHFFDT